MIAYFDTSALVPLLITEPTTSACRRIWNEADETVTCRLGFVEAAAALAQAQRLNRLTTAQHTEARHNLDGLWTRLQVIEFEEELMRRAAEHAARFSLRGYDAVHAAAAELFADDEVVAAAGDQALLAAWTALGITTYDPHAR